MNNKQSNSLLRSFLVTVLTVTVFVDLASVTNIDKVCSVLTKDGEGQPGPKIPVKPDVRFSRASWNALSFNSSVYGVEVPSGCVIRICHLDNITANKFQRCEDFDKATTFTADEKEYRWDFSKNTVLGLDCSCTVPTEPCITSCEDQFLPMESKSCATLFLDTNCSDCRFKPIPLTVGANAYDRDFSVISSVFVRPNCTVENMRRTMHGDRLPFLMAPQNKESHSDINAVQYDHNEFTCRCDDFKSDFSSSVQIPASSQSQPSPIQIIILGVVSAIAFFTAFIASILAYRCSMAATKEAKAHLYSIIESLDEKYHIPKENIVIDYSKILGEGRFGIVYEGCLRTSDGFSKAVAIKQIVPSNNYIYRSLAREISVLATIGSHPKVVAMIGVVIDRDAAQQGFNQLVLELCELTSLEKFLNKHRLRFIYNLTHGSRNNNTSTILTGYTPEPETSPTDEFTNSSLTLYKLLDWSYQIALGMDYISGLKILHLDLQARNILVDGDINVKIGDFGLSKELNEDYHYIKPPVKEPLPWRALAPEVIGNYKFTLKTDIWAYGILLWEIFSLGETPYSEFTLTSEEQLKDILVGNYRLRKPDLCPPEIYNVMESCWNPDAAKRPDFLILKRIFEALLAADFESSYI